MKKKNFHLVCRFESLWLSLFVRSFRFLKERLAFLISVVLLRYARLEDFVLIHLSLSMPISRSFEQDLASSVLIAVP